MSSKYAIAAVLGVSLAGLAGCSGDGKDEVKVSGKISIDGEPIPRGTITFVSADGSTPTGGGVITDGTYTAMVPPGPKKVMVLGNKIVGTEPSLRGVPDSTPRNVYETLTPLEYNAAHVTPLTAIIVDETEGLDFELTKAAGKRRKN